MKKTGRPSKQAQAKMIARVRHSPEDETLLTVDDACRWLRVTRGTLYRWTARKRNKLAVVKLGGRALRFRREDVQGFIEKSLR